MKKVQLDHHISSKFDSELEDIRSRLLAMGGEVKEQLADSLEALVKGDVELARRVIHRDDEINAAEGTIDRLCTTLLARRQPTAGDLRFVIAVLKSITHLERIGDEAEKIARVSVSLADVDRPKNNYRDLIHLGDRVSELIHEAMDSMARFDTELAVKISRADRDVDQEYDSILRNAITYMMEDSHNVRRILDTIWIARALERIGDHAKNIGEYVIYIVHGDDVRHASIDEMQRTIAADQDEGETGAS